MNRANPSRGLELILVFVAGAVALGWVWINFCRFPGSPWNDIRLEAVFMAAKSEAVYTLPGAGILNTWMYGPVPLWAWWPATFAKSAIAALLGAGMLNILLSLAVIAATCRWWPEENAGPAARALAFAGCLALWPDHVFRFLQADNVAVALGLFSNLLLIRGGAGWRGWIAAGATAAALGSKQTTVGLLAGQLAWIGWERGRSATLGHLARTLACGAVLLVLAGLQFGFHELWFGLVAIPRKLPPADDLGARIREMAPYLAVQAVLPLALAAATWRRWLIRGQSSGLPVITFLCSLPLGLIGVLSAGGTINSFQGFQYLLPAILLVAFARWTARSALIGAAVVLAVATRVVLADEAPAIPALGEVRHAIALQQARPGEIWLPWNPMVSYFGEGRFYHAEDGIYVRFITGNPVSIRQAQAGLPPRFHAMAFPNPRLQWGVAAKLAPPNAIERREGAWLLVEWPP